MTPLEEAIIKTVAERNGCKSTELAAELAPDLLRGNSFIETVEKLINDKLLVEIEYVLPAHTGRIKSFLLPTGTLLNVRE